MEVEILEKLCLFVHDFADFQTYSPFVHHLVSFIHSKEKQERNEKQETKKEKKKSIRSILSISGHVFPNIWIEHGDTPAKLISRTPDFNILYTISGTTKTLVDPTLCLDDIHGEFMGVLDPMIGPKKYAETVMGKGFLFFKWMVANDYQYCYETMEIAAYLNDTSIMDFLVSKGIELSQSTMNGAARGGHFELVQSLQNIPSCSVHIWPVPSNAVVSNNLQLVEYILHDMKECYGTVPPYVFETMLNQAARMNHVQILDSILKHSDVIPTCTYFVEKLVKHGDLELFIKYIKRAGNHPLFCQRDYRTVIQFGHDHILNYMLAQGLQIPSCVVAYAASYNRRDLVDKFLEMGCPKHLSAIGCAASKGHLDMMNYLKSLGFKVSLRSFYLAIQSGKVDIMEWILRHRSPPIQRQNIGYTRLAAQLGHLSILKWLRSKGFAWDGSVSMSGTHSLDMIQYFVENHCPINQETMRHAIRDGNMDVVEYLHQHNCPATPTAGLAAIETGNFKLLRWLHDHSYPWHKQKFIEDAEVYGYVQIKAWLQSFE